jgi:hypothetical protein
MKGPGGLRLLFVLVLGLCVREIWRTSQGGDQSPYAFLRPQILDVGSAVTLLVGVASLLALRNQFALSQRPWLAYSTRWLDSDQGVELTLARPSLIWVATLTNAGPGTAVIASAKYAAVLATPAGPESVEGVSGLELIRALGALGHREHLDFGISNISAGFAVPPGGTVRICEIPEESMSWLSRLDIDLLYDSLLGDQYSKKVSCIRQGIPPRSGQAP